MIGMSMITYIWNALLKFPVSHLSADIQYMPGETSKVE